MQLAIPLPWWVLVLLVIAVVAVAWGAYAQLLVPVPRAKRSALVALRALTLLFLLACLLRPVRVMPPDTESDAVVPVLLDVSRSMGLPDVDGRPRIDLAREVVSQKVAPALKGRFVSEIWTFGDTLARAQDGTLAPAARSSDLSGALRAVRERYRERRVAGIVVVSDGGDTGAQDAAESVDDGGTPVFTLGIGSARVAPDLEVLDVAAGEAALTDSSIDLTVSAVSRTYGRSDRPSFQVRVLENGRPVDVRTVTPAGPDSPVREVFTVSPSRETATVYTVEIPTATGELVSENNRRSVLVSPPGRTRRVLVVEGAPGFEHTFLKRALASDPGIEVDSVVRKGRDERGAATFFVQAAAARAPQLATGFPVDREALYRYDAVIFANIEPDSLTRVQLEGATEFVGERGGGVLVLGAKSFAQQGFVGTALEEALPVDLRDRGSGVVRTSQRDGREYRVRLTAEGVSHPVMRVGSSAEETEKLWASAPALAGATALGAPRPGAQVLALTDTADGVRPVVAVHRFGRGRAMIFAGEASWRWRMQLPSTDRTHELFWRQAARWLASSAPDPVAAAPLPNVIPGTTQRVSVDVRNAAFEPVHDAEVTMRVTLPGGDVRDLKPTLADARTGRYAVQTRFEQPGVYRVVAEARQGRETLGRVEQWVLAGAADLEMADPRLNEDVLRRVSRASGGRYLDAADLARLPSLLASSADPAPPRLQELWHNIWLFIAVVMLLGAEWYLRRRWGMR
ncbi:MAG: hypothetical protein ACRD26_22650 [Vicinamibacterales bacterium]